MRKRAITGVLVLSGIVWFSMRQTNKQAEQINQIVSESPQTSGSAETFIKRSPDGSPMTLAEHVSKFEQRMKEKAEGRERGLDEWRTPIEFYGKVVDENETPVQGTQIEFSCTDLSAAGNSYYRTTSDAAGLFSLNNVQGKLLVVRNIEKEGYYVSKQNRNNFFYAGENENFIPDVGNPIVFRLRKKGQAEPLVVSEGIFSVSISGKLLEIDLKTGKATASGKGNLIVEFYRTPLDQTKGQIYDWSFQISVPGGGLALSTNEFDFLAAKGGYEPVGKIETPASLEKQWYGRFNRKYFIRFADGTYGRILVDLMSYNGSLKIESFINPSGSRNLEYNEAVQPKQTVSE